ncbi:MAG: iron-sulfur cluster repair di-iron protein [Acidobacteriota bacterium]|nr:iron-sulfur cluster repair di-iron protein [Acidobacteriota bacterium]
MNATSDVTVRDLVTRDFRAAAVFHRFGIDFCCGGGKPLADVCRAKRLDEAHVLDEINRACAAPDSGAPRYADWQADDLTHHIVGRHHGYCRAMMPTIAAHAHKLAQVHGPAHRELVEIAEIFDRMCEEMDAHMAKEEAMLFPYIDLLAASRRGGVAPFPAPFGDVGNPIRMMEAEHESAGAAMARIRELTDGYAVPAHGCATWRVTLQELEAFEQDLHTHVHLENNVLFPKARALAAGAVAPAG